jgi:GNAT superfamily N-acetyltransferase
MPSIQICSFDPHEARAEQWAAFHRYRRAVAAELEPEDPLLSDEEKKSEMQQISPLWEYQRWLALEGEEIIGSAIVSFRRAQTPNAAEHAPFLFGGGSIRAEARRRGAGTLLLREIHSLMSALDKRVLTLEAHTAAGHAFLACAGAIPKFTVVENRAVLAELDWGRLLQWEDAAGMLGHVWEHYSDRVPRDRLIELLPQFTALATGLPVGELEMAPIRYEIEAYDRWYEEIEPAGGAHHMIVLRAPCGKVSGISEARWDARTPEFVQQQITAVADQWRGRGLARSLKAAMLRQIRTHDPEVKFVSTVNAETNTAILAINERVGFTKHRRTVSYQITRTALDVWHLRLG